MTVKFLNRKKMINVIMLQSYNLSHDSCFSFCSFFITNKTDLNGESNKRAKWPVE